MFLSRFTLNEVWRKFAKEARWFILSIICWNFVYLTVKFSMKEKLIFLQTAEKLKHIRTVPIKPVNLMWSWEAQSVGIRRVFRLTWQSMEYEKLGFVNMNYRGSMVKFIIRKVCLLYTRFDYGNNSVSYGKIVER